jgi:hypothetical protein
MDFAEHGAGLPGFSVNQSLIHSALDRVLSRTGVPMPGNSHASNGGDSIDTLGLVLVSGTEHWKDDESGANTMASV